MFGNKSRGQVIGEELSEGLSHVRTAANEATRAAAEALTPRVEAARDAVTPRVEAAKDALEGRLVVARDQADARRAEFAEQSRRKAKKTAKRAGKNAKKAKKVAVGARKDAKAARADAKAQAKAAAGPGRSGRKKRRRLPWLLVIAGIIGVLIAKSRSKSDDDLWGSRSDSPVPGYTEDPQPSTVSDKVDAYKSVAPDKDGPLQGKLANSADASGTDAGDTPKEQHDTAAEMIEATKDSADTPNVTEPPKHAASDDGGAASKPADA